MVDGTIDGFILGDELGICVGDIEGTSDGCVDSEGFKLGRMDRVGL